MKKSKEPQRKFIKMASHLLDDSHYKRGNFCNVTKKGPTASLVVRTPHGIKLDSSAFEGSKTLQSGAEVTTMF